MLRYFFQSKPTQRIVKQLWQSRIVIERLSKNLKEWFQQNLSWFVFSLPNIIVVVVVVVIVAVVVVVVIVAVVVVVVIIAVVAVAAFTVEWFLKSKF